MASLRWSLFLVLAVAVRCTTPAYLTRPERMDVTMTYPDLRVDAVDQYGGHPGRPPTDLVFLFTNRSLNDTILIDPGQASVTEHGQRMALRTALTKVVLLLPLEVEPCRVFWSGAHPEPARSLSPGARFEFPFTHGGQRDTAFCVLR